MSINWNPIKIQSDKFWIPGRPETEGKDSHNQFVKPQLGETRKDIMVFPKGLVMVMFGYENGKPFTSFQTVLDGIRYAGWVDDFIMYQTDKLAEEFINTAHEQHCLVLHFKKQTS